MLAEERRQRAFLPLEHRGRSASEPSEAAREEADLRLLTRWPGRGTLRSGPLGFDRGLETDAACRGAHPPRQKRTRKHSCEQQRLRPSGNRLRPRPTPRRFSRARSSSRKPRRESCSSSRTETQSWRRGNLRIDGLTITGTHVEASEEELVDGGFEAPRVHQRKAGRNPGLSATIYPSYRWPNFFASCMKIPSWVLVLGGPEYGVGISGVGQLFRWQRNPTGPSFSSRRRGSDACTSSPGEALSGAIGRGFSVSFWWMKVRPMAVSP